MAEWRFGQESNYNYWSQGRFFVARAKEYTTPDDFNIVYGDYDGIGADIRIQYRQIILRSIDEIDHEAQIVTYSCSVSYAVSSDRTIDFESNNDTSFTSLTGDLILQVVAAGKYTKLTKPFFTGLVNAANDAAAAVAGVAVSGVYRNGSVLMVRVA